MPVVPPADGYAFKQSIDGSKVNSPPKVQKGNFISRHWNQLSPSQKMVCKLTAIALATLVGMGLIIAAEVLTAGAVNAIPAGAALAMFITGGLLCKVPVVFSVYSLAKLFRLQRSH